MKYVPVLIVALVVFVSCDKASNKVQSTTQSATTSAAASANNQQPTSNTNDKAKAGRINPKHGEPGHTCSVPEGAVIPEGNVQAEPVIKTEIVPGSQKPLTSANSAPTTVVTGMNPQHGQPGHRCDIPVGAPLNSKPAQ